MISIILPALRPSLTEAAIDSIRRASDGIDYEIVVVSPHAVSGDRIVHVPEKIQKGVCSAQAEGFEAARGNIIAAFSEDHLALKGWLAPLERIIAERERQHFPFAGGLSRPDSPIIGTVYGLYYPYFPVLSRRSIEAIGGWFSPDFIAHFGDPDIGMRVWKNGGRCEIIYECHALSNVDEDPASESEHKKTTLQKDFSTFVGKYHAEFGKDFKVEYQDINTDYLINVLEDRSFEKRIPERLYDPVPQLDLFRKGIRKRAGKTKRSRLFSRLHRSALKRLGMLPPKKA